MEHDPLGDGDDALLGVIEGVELRKHGFVGETHGEQSQQYRIEKVIRVITSFTDKDRMQEEQ